MAGTIQEDLGGETFRSARQTIINHKKAKKMKNILQFDSSQNKEKNTLTIRREFFGRPATGWDCYTKRELLDQWFAPKPLTTKTKSMDFREGGHWHYAMVEPNGTEYWGLTEYRENKTH